MKNVPPPCSPRGSRGAALVLVLCFVVLITGLAVAYFSRAMVSRQAANASTTTAQAGTVANSAVDILVGDLKQEIVNGSTTPAPAAGTGTLYLPKQAANAVPQRNASPAATADTPGGPLPNLVRRSARADTTSGNANYVPAPALTSRASAASTTTASANGRSVSTARWNRHYLLPTKGATDPSTPVDGADGFTAPDWVFVTTEKGPCVLSAPTREAGGGSVNVVGRYAYAVYDEGGLLDINHTGYPSASTLAHVGAKPAPSYADLTQLDPGASGPAAMTAANVDKLLAWRHYATLQASGSFPSPGLQPSASQADAAYYRLFISNPTNLLQVPPTVWSGKTDQAFLSRQQLVGYFAAAGLDTKYLQYLGTFSRGLNQPSYAPESTRPTVLRPENGGNNSYGNDGINPSFLTARVAHAFGQSRPDGTTAAVGEPLVKKRFPLNRLAWLTYKGPSHDRNQNDADMAALIAAGIPAEFLSAGTADKIELCFGLRWDPTTKWTYVHGSSGASGRILNVSNAASQPDVVSLDPGREPDFFELLKASINPGSLAKTSLVSTTGQTTDAAQRAMRDQYNADTSLDAAILQIGANIIDQFDTDGFPTRINYNLSGTGTYSDAVYGDENLPYIARVRSGLIRLVEANPAETDSSAVANNSPIVNTGIGALMNYPEVWNPHGWSSNNLAQSFGVVGPRNFKIYAQTHKTNGIAPAISVFAWNTFKNSNGDTVHHNSYDVDPDPNNSPGFSDTYKFPFGSPDSGKGGEPRILTEDNTAMTFTVGATATGGALFREPTVLCMRGVPDGSSLAAPALVYNAADNPNGLGHLSVTRSFFADASGALTGGLLSAVAGEGDLVGPRMLAPDGATKVAYVGFYIGAHPLRWADAKTGTTQKSTPVYQTWFGGTNDVTYVLACEDGNGGGNMLLYDQKNLTTGGAPDCDLNTGTDAGFGLTGTTRTTGSSNLDYGVRYYETVDPRTARFGLLDAWIQSPGNSIPPRRSVSVIDATQATIKPPREGANAGMAMFFDPSSPASWFAALAGWYHDASLNPHYAVRPGLLAQNNPNITPDGTVGSDPRLDPFNVTGNTYPPFYYTDADGVARRASAGNVPGGTGSPANTMVGLPAAYANSTGTYGASYSSGAQARQMDSRPVILNRPFRSVAELGYVYSGTPWKNLDFFQVESGNAALLDVFCVNDASDDNALTAGQVNLNTRQVPVLRAILSQANKDQWNDATTAPSRPDEVTLRGSPASTQARDIAQLLVKRTVMGPTSGPNASQGAQPLGNISDLVGRWVRSVALPAVAGSNATVAAGISGQASCDGFAGDLAATITSPDSTHNIQRFNEGAVRALANAGQTRVWNLLFDIVAQTGRFPTQAATLDGFNVEGEQHCWVHVAIDRCTGQVIDKQVEIVTE